MNKLPYNEWVEKYFTKDNDYKFWINHYEQQELGFAPSDLSRWKEKDLKEEYVLYLKDENDFIKYDESTNEKVEN